MVNGEIIKKNKGNDTIVAFKGEVQSYFPFNATGIMKISL
jgi:hypothetical protein